MRFSALGSASAALVLLAAAPVVAEDSPDPGEETAEPDASATDDKAARVDRFLEALSGSSLLLEHSFSIGHLGDLSPEASRTNSRSLIGTLSLAPTKKFGLDVQISLVQELTPTDTTFAREVLLNDVAVDLSLALPAPKQGEGPFSWAMGLGFDTPTSKAARASSLILGLRPGIELDLTFPLLDGFSVGYGIAPSPRFHRDTTASTLVEYPCSPAAGCNGGLTTDTGARNTSFQLSHDFSLGLTALDDRLSVSASLQLLYSWRYGKTSSPRWSEETLANPDNGNGNPVELTSTFLLDLSFRIHESVGISAGLWTAGGMSPSGGYYNPLGNRFSQLYFDLVFYPVDTAAATRKKAKAAKE